MAQKYDIFISYRRKGGVKDARLVDEKLRNSGYTVSFDIDTLGRGKFTDTLKSRLEVCKDFIVIFEPSYYERFYDEHGHQQPEDVLDEDWCYLELKNALLMEKNIIPLVPKDFIFPKNLPKYVKDITEMNAIQLTEKEFKEIFEYKVKSYLISKPKFTYRHKKSIMAALSLFVLAIMAFFAFFALDSQKKAAEREARAAFVVDSIKKLSEARTQSILDSLAKEKENSPSPNANAKSNAKAELYWAGNGDETGEIIFGKISRAGLKKGKCSGNGIKVSANKPACSPNAVGQVKCSYSPQITATACNGSSVDKFALGKTFSGTSKDEAASKQKMQEELKNADFSSLISQLQSIKR